MSRGTNIAESRATLIASRNKHVKEDAAQFQTLLHEGLAGDSGCNNSQSHSHGYK